MSSKSTTLGKVVSIEIVNQINNINYVKGKALFLDLATYIKTRGSVAKVKIQVDLTKIDHLIYGWGMMKTKMVKECDKIYSMREYLLIVTIANTKDIYPRIVL
ncbi:hypothetical protein FXO38_11786 [Capsicum annuum]|nr:hypothetical protein FXO38_11786 [Capsicum annuum]